jgi:hypothetical protein
VSFPRVLMRYELDAGRTQRPDRHGDRRSFGHAASYMWPGMMAGCRLANNRLTRRPITRIMVI